MSDPSHRHTGRQFLRAGVTFAVTLALVAGNQHDGMTAAAATPKPDKAIELRKDKSVPGVTAKPAARPVDPAVVDATRPHPLQTSWPAAATATATVPAPGDGTSLSRWNAVLSADPVQTRQRAGNLPVWISPGAAARKSWLTKGVATGPAKVEVSISGRRGDALQIDVHRADGAKAAGTVGLTLDYAAFQDTYGGGWANRLRLYDARTGKSFATSNKGDGTLQADVPTGASLMMAAAESGGGGDYGKGMGGGAGKWSIGGPSGAFEWSLPLESPPGMGGPQPAVELQYSSASLDGLTSASNNQVSAAGQGFDISGGGAIERKLKSCSKDPGNNGTKLTGDLCFATENAGISMGGKSGDLLLVSKSATSEVWRMRGDDGTVVEKLWGATNGDDGIAVNEKGEYWRVTTKDGTKYYFGLNRLPGWTAGKTETRSAMTMPVFGNNSGEQCNKTAFADSWCQQAYRWNLDYVVDRHGNTMSQFYDVETGNYARNVTATSVSPYVRGSNLHTIEYGQRDGQVYTQNPVGKMVFTTAERCEGVSCGPAQPASYPDTPWDLNCASTTNCDNHFTPTFWTQKRLSTVTSQVWRSTGLTDVQTWTLRHEYTNGAGTGRALWLEGVSSTGKVGGDLQMPETNFDGIGLDNRVDPQNPSLPNMVWFRVQSIHYGTGGDVAVTYSDKECSATTLPDAANNTKLCRPQRWTPKDQGERQDWFHKYVVREASEVDRSATSSVPAAPVPVTSRVEYLGTPAWHFDEQDGLAETTTHTWNQWRGYEKVRVYKGAEGGTQSITETQYYRGMNGDQKADGTPRTVKLTDSTGTSVDDQDEFSGQVREQITYNGAAVVNKTINDYWRSPQPTATETRPWGTRYAYMTAQKAVTQYQAVDGGMLDIANRHEYDTRGRLVSKQLANDASTTADDTCTRYQYLENPDAGLQELVSREQVVSVGCDQPWTKDQVVSDERVYYDDHTSVTAAPTRGVPTRGERLSGFDSNGEPKYETVFTATFDQYGRRTSMSNAANQTSRISFEPAYGPLTKVTQTAPNGLQSSEEYEPAWGSRIATTGPDGKRTDLTLDPVGRTAKVWNPGHPKATSPADVEYEYLLRGDASSAVTTRARLANGKYDVTYELYDGLQRLRQTQEGTPAGGRLVTDYRYDSRGRQSIVSGAYYNDGQPGTEILYVNDLNVPKQQISLWDGADRPSAQIYLSEGQEKYRTSHQVTATRQSIDPPQGEAPTARITDARGRLTELRTYKGDTWSGAYDSTKYTYTPLGQLKTMSDAAGNVWSYQYDIQGRRIAENDPDRGTTTYTFNAIDQIVSSTDARGRTTAFTYDDLGRKTSQRSGSVTGPVQISWTYDTLAKGQPTSTTRYLNGNPYTTAITGYDDAGRPTGTSLTVPGSEGALAGTYVMGQTYTDDGKVASRSLPSAGDLAAETVSVDYNDQSLPTALRSGLGTYVRNTTYTPFEEKDTLTLGTVNGRYVQQRYEYEYGSRRLSRVVTDRELSPKRISDTEYNYDPAGNVTKIIDTPSTASGEATDTQCFNYDYLRRLTQAWTPGAGDCAAAPTAAGLGGPAPYWQSWTFDQAGNRLSEKRVTPTGATTTSTYTYGANSHPNALKSVSTTGPAGTTTTGFGYDETGNLTSRTKGTDTENLTWTDDGKLAASSKGSSFVYDGDGNRILRRDTSGTTLYLGETEILLGTDGQLHGTRYYTLGDSVVAVRTGGKLSWLLSDLHGSPTIAVDSVSQTVQRRRTAPYGDPRGTAPTDWPGQRGFHKGTTDPDTGFVHLGAREYDPTVGRFISVDPEIDPEDPAQLNAYAYANNNPVSFEDSDGRFAFVLIPVITFTPEIIAAIVVVFTLLVIFVKYIVQVIEWVVEKVWNFLCWLWEKITRAVTRFQERYRTEVKEIEQRILQVSIRIVQRIKWTVKRIADQIRKEPRKPDVVKPKPNQPKPKPKPETPKPPNTRPEGPGRPGNKPDKPNRGNAAERIKQEGQQRRAQEREQAAEQKRRLDEFQEQLNEQLGNPKPEQWKAETQERVDGGDPIKYPDGTPKTKGPYDSKDFSSATGSGWGWKIFLGGELIRRAWQQGHDWGLW
ncbi:RHS repeat-associated core domain-containing protein [Kribbella sp. NPDC051587]|uniref:RHS repeat-associated core domain-containing protein n=1 Tax=Kribbella sp. NPDC051587 TaxID=3364119 RepID=UPI00379901A2